MFPSMPKTKSLKLNSHLMSSCVWNICTENFQIVYHLSSYNDDVLNVFRHVYIIDDIDIYLIFLTLKI